MLIKCIYIVFIYLCTCTLKKYHGLNIVEYQMWNLAPLKILSILNKSEKCEGDFHIFNGDSEFESQVFWKIKIGRNFTKY